MKTLINKISQNIKIILFVVLFSLVFFMIFILNGLYIPDLISISNDILSSKNSEISAFLRQNITKIETLANFIDPKLSIQSNVNRLTQFANIEATYESFGVVDLNGEIRVTNGAIFNIENRDYFQKLKSSSQQTIVSQPVVSKDDHIPIILILTKIYDDKGEVALYLSSAVSMNTIEHIINESNSFDFEISILNKDSAQVYLRVGNVQSGYKEIVQPITVKPDWLLSMRIPYSFLYSKLIVSIVLLLLVSSIILFVGIRLIKYKVTQSIQPLENLTLAIKAAPDQLKPIDVETITQEIYDLQESTNVMLNKINDLIKRIEITERAKNESEYRALIQQIKPHFLYNTLEMIQSFTLDFEDDRAEKAIGLLANFFRISLSNDSLFIPLSKELNQIESYAKIQQLRYDDKFKLSITNTLDYDPYFLHFTLQPVIENAIYHGIKQQKGNGWIDVNCQQLNDQLQVTIRNSVDKVDANKINALNLLFKTSDNPQDYPGYGLYNVRQRLKINFNNKADISIHYDTNSVSIIIIHPIITKEKLNEYLDC